MDAVHSCETCFWCAGGGICMNPGGNPDEHAQDERGCVDWFPLDDEILSLKEGA